MISTLDKEFAFVFLDLNMPEMSGVDCLRHIKKAGIAPNTRFIACSAIPELEFKHGDEFDYFVSKPVTCQSLKEIIE